MAAASVRDEGSWHSSMANRRTLDGSADAPLDESPLAQPSTMFETSGGYAGSMQAPQRRSMSGQVNNPAEEIVPQYIPPATMGQLFQELRRR